jgi:hypothetical protein
VVKSFVITLAVMYSCLKV